jgi:predicted DNA-binding transcriptional regulator YafY
MTGKIDDLTVVQFWYRNHHGKVQLRTCRPIRIWYGSTAFHPEGGWLLEGWDLDKNATRDYAMKGMMSGWDRVDKAYPKGDEIKIEDGSSNAVADGSQPAKPACAVASSPGNRCRE